MKYFTPNTNYQVILILCRLLFPRSASAAVRPCGMIESPPEKDRADAEKKNRAKSAP